MSLLERCLFVLCFLLICTYISNEQQTQNVTQASPQNDPPIQTEPVQQSEQQTLANPTPSTTIITTLEYDGASTNPEVAAIVIWAVVILLVAFTAVFLLLLCCFSFRRTVQQKYSSQKRQTSSLKLVNITLSIDNGKRKLLDNITCNFYPGTVTAVMGPSGSGKTTLIKSIIGANSIAKSKLTGYIGFNDKAVTESLVASKKCCYVPQNDILTLHGLTVQENIAFAAEFQLKLKSRSERKQRVKEVIQMLNLHEVRHNVIKSFNMVNVEGVSGGQLRRVMVATEGLVADGIKLLVLDEPTTGLSSTDALELASVLHKLAHEHNYTIIYSMHQPDQVMFNQYVDRLLLLHKGAQVYFGPTNDKLFLSKWFKSAQQWQKKNYNEDDDDEDEADDTPMMSLNLAKLENPANSMMDIVSNKKSAKVLKKYWQSDENNDHKYMFISNDINKDNGADELLKTVGTPSLLMLLAEFVFATLTEMFTWFSLIVKLLWRNPNAVRTAMIVESVAAVIIGLVFLQHDFADIAQRGAAFGACFKCISITNFTNWVTFYSQLKPFVLVSIKSNRFSLPIYCVALQIATVVRITFILLPYITIIYWMVGFPADIVNYLAIAVTVILTDIIVHYWGMFFAFVLPTFRVATLIVQAVLVITLTYMSYHAPRYIIPVFVRWLVDINYLYYSFEIITHFALSSLSFDCLSSTERIIGGNCEIDGAVVLQFQGLNSRISLAFAIILLYITAAALCFVFATMFYSMFITYKLDSIYLDLDQQDPSIEYQPQGARMLKRKSTFIGRAQGLTTLLSNTFKTQVLDAVGQMERRASASLPPQAIDFSDDTAKTAKKISACTFQTLDCVISFKYKQRSFSCFNKEKQGYAIQNVTTKINVGEFIAVMGPSGSGKSTFVKSLFNFGKLNGDVYGEIKLNGKIVDDYFGFTNSGFVAAVQQFSFIPPELTVLEAFTFAADTQLPANLTFFEKTNFIISTLKILDLYHVKDLKIGQISGGQLKRTEIAVDALLTTARIIILDEPTSGLSAADTVKLVYLLRQFAKSLDYTIIVILHQPRSQVFESFDKILLMSNGQQVCFTAPDSLIAYFTADDDFSGSVAEAVIQAASDKESANTLKDYFSESNLNGSVEIVDTDVSSTPCDALDVLPKKNNASFLTQLLALYWRETLIVSRSPLHFITIIVQIAFCSVLLGLAGFQIGERARDVTPRVGIIYFYQNHVAFSMAILGFTFLHQLNFRLHEIDLLKYPAASIILVDLHSSFIRAIFSTILPSIVFYFLVGLKESFWSFWIFYFATILLGMWLEYYIYFFVVLLKSTAKVAAIAFAPLALLKLSNGFYIKVDDLPSYLAWARWISPFSYVMEIVLNTQIAGETFDCDSDSDSYLFMSCPLKGTDFIEDIGFDTNDWVVTRNIGILLAFILFWISLTCMLILYRARGAARFHHIKGGVSKIKD